MVLGRRIALALAIGLPLAGCAPPAPAVSAQSWPQADTLFRGDVAWLGSDAAYSADLGGGRRRRAAAGGRLRRDAITYAAKGHPELAGADLVVTYASNAHDFATLVADMSLYYPRFVRLTFE